MRAPVDQKAANSKIITRRKKKRKTKKMGMYRRM